MEDSEKRRDRLKAMRMQADQTEASSNVASLAVPVSLSNPLLETSATMDVQEESRAPRFDFYTDPMAAFSDSRKRSEAGNQIRQDCFTSPSNHGSPMARFSPSLPGPRNPGMTPPPAHQIQTSSSPHQMMYQVQGSYYNSGPHGSPIGTASPFSMHPRTPEVWNGPMNPTSYRFPSNPSRGGHLPSPGFGPRGSPRFNTGQGRDHWVSHSPSPGSRHGGSPSPGSGRGGGRWYGSSMSPGLGQSSGRGRGSHAHPSTPERFYNESMLDDPWKLLEPVVWRSVSALVNSLNTPASPKSWITKSPITKRPKVSEFSNKSSSQPSLAEILAASFNESVNDASST